MSVLEYGDVCGGANLALAAADGIVMIDEVLRADGEGSGEIVLRSIRQILHCIGGKSIVDFWQEAGRERISEVYCSTSNRCVQTARIITKGQKCRTYFCDELREIDTGDLTGLSHEQIERKYPRAFDLIFEVRRGNCPAVRACWMCGKG